MRTMIPDTRRTVEVTRLRAPVLPVRLERGCLTAESITRREFLFGAGSLLVLAPYGCGAEDSGEASGP